MSNDEKTIEYKFALLGESSVGKTSIFKKMTFGYFYEKSVSTIGVEKKTINYENIEIEINGEKEKKTFNISFFDTAGQEKYRSIAKNYIKGSDGIILIYDITNRKSFELVESWLNSILEILPDWKKSDYLIMLLGNKLDLAKKERQNKFDPIREVETEEAKKKCEDNSLYWGGECSAKNFTDSELKDLFKDFIIALYKKIGKKKSNSMELKNLGKKGKKCC